MEVHGVVLEVVVEPQGVVLEVVVEVQGVACGGGSGGCIGGWITVYWPSN